MPLRLTATLKALGATPTPSPTLLTEALRAATAVRATAASARGDTAPTTPTTGVYADISALTEDELRTCLTARLTDPRAEVTAAWPADGTAAKLPAGRLIAAIGDLWYPSQDDLIVLHTTPAGPAVLILDHEEHLTAARLPSAPLPVGPTVNPALAGRIVAGCRAVGAPHLLYERPDAPPVPLPLTTDLTALRPPCVLATPDDTGTVHYPEPGHALISGTPRFLSAALAEGVEEARTRFARHARVLADRQPALLAVAAAHPATHRAWTDPSEVPPGSVTAHRLSLLQAFVSGDAVDGPSADSFAMAWHSARRSADAAGERVRGRLAELFDAVFMALEDRDDALLPASDLTTAVRSLMAAADLSPAGRTNSR
ncbi:hypothetical protein [Streptomyces sp. NPDC127092]|uniref:hypothetical protein n=1 Tax=Streptomyces sp. NPDC127092 TaxID=3347135 RepID=UPI00365DFE18